MNNSRLILDVAALAEEKKEDIKPRLREQEQRLVRIIESIQAVKDSKEWGTLKTELFDGLADKLEKSLKTEAKHDNPSTNKLNRLTGELKWAEKYADLSKLEQEHRVELQRVRITLHGKPD